jgi:biopolymer transport protein ExbD
MAEIAEGGGGGGHAKGGKKRPKKQSTRIDMTPMVDLAFLLLTFFVLTSTFSKSKVMSLVYPAKPKDEVKPDDQEKIFNALTFIVTEDQLYYYKGQLYAPGLPNAAGAPMTQLTAVDFGPQGVRKLLADENRYVTTRKAELDKEAERTNMADSTYKNRMIEIKQADEAVKVLIKTDAKATTKNFIDLVDELKIAGIGVIAPVDITQAEMDLLKAKGH